MREMTAIILSVFPTLKLESGEYCIHAFFKLETHKVTSKKFNIAENM